MRHSLILASMVPAASFATDLIVFEANKPAIARDVNTNFSRLDSAIQGRPTKADLGSTDGLLKSALNSISQLQTGKADQSGVDKALAAKADQAAVDKALATKVDQAAVDKVVGAKADTAALGELSRKQRADSASLGNALKSTLTSGSLGGIRDTLKLKADTAAFNAYKRQTESVLSGKQAALGFTPLNAAGGTVSGDLKVAQTLSAGGFISPVVQTDTLLIPGARFQIYPDGNGGAIYPDKGGVPGQTNYVVAWQRDGQSVYLRSANKYLGTRASQTFPVYNDGVADRAVLHTGMFDTTRYVKSDAVVFKGDEYDDITTKINPNGSLKNMGNTYSSLRNAIDFRWYNSHWQIGSMRSGGMNSDGFGVSSGDSALRFLVQEGGATVYGGFYATGRISAAGGVSATQADLGNVRVTGTLTTAPGATPADYVFEPDYKLAPLAEVEAYTKENKHLPEVPSAAEMTSQGVDLAKMNMVLLKKVEELTLHAIAQEKRLDQQEKLIDQLRNDRSIR